MLDDPPDYEAIEREQWEEAQRAIVYEVRNPTPRLLKRIATFIGRFGYREDEVLKKIERDEMFAAHFAKEPKRTGLHEYTAASWLRKLPWVNDFEILPKAGKDSMKVTSDGNIVSALKLANVPGKSLDFKWQTGKTTFYAMHKYTKEGGGSQDSQYQEMIELMKRFHGCNENRIVLLVIVDGPYYQENDARKLKTLQQQQRLREPKSFALSIKDVPKILKEYG